MAIETFTVLNWRRNVMNFGVNHQKMNTAINRQANPMNRRIGPVAKGITIGVMGTSAAAAAHAIPAAAGIPEYSTTNDRQLR